MGVTTQLSTTIPELEAYLGGRNPLCDFLVETVKGYHDDHFAWSKPIWDVAAIAWLLDGTWLDSELVASPIVTDQGTWSVGPAPASNPGRQFYPPGPHLPRPVHPAAVALGLVGPAGPPGTRDKVRIYHRAQARPDVILFLEAEEGETWQSGT